MFNIYDCQGIHLQIDQSILLQMSYSELHTNLVQFAGQLLVRGIFQARCQKVD